MRRAERVSWALALLALASPAQAQVRRALLIGIDKYQSLAVEKLRSCVRDVDAMEQLLRSPHWNFTRIRTLKDSEATRVAILDGMRAIVAEAGSADTVLIHFSGHGGTAPDLNGDENLARRGDTRDETIVPVDGRTRDVADILDDELYDILQNLKTRNAIVILDCCHAGTVTGKGDVRFRCAGHDAREELYRFNAANKRGDGAGPQGDYVLLGMAGDAPCGLVDGTRNGALTHSLLAAWRARPDSSAAELLEGIRKRCTDLVRTWKLERAPTPQLELRPERKGETLLAAAPPSGDLVEVRGIKRPGRGTGQRASPPSQRTLAVEIKGPGQVVTALRDALPRLLPEVRVGAAEPVLTIAMADGMCVVDHAGRLLGAFEYGDTGTVAERLAGVIRRARQTSELLAISNPDPGFALQVSVLGGLPSGQREVLVRGIEPTRRREGVAELARFRIRRSVDGRPERATSANSLRLEVRADRDCYLTIVNVDAMSKVCVLLPGGTTDRLLRDGRVAAGRRISIPPSLSEDPEENPMGMTWDTVGPAGIDTFRVFACTSLDDARRLRARLEAIIRDAGRGDRIGFVEATAGRAAPEWEGAWAVEDVRIRIVE